MASSSGNSSGSGSIQTPNSGTKPDPGVLIDQRKKRRMESNRESARRSRIRKQKHLNDLTTQVEQLRKENSQIVTTVSITNQHFLNVEAENSVLRAQMVELSHRLDSLNEILGYMNMVNGAVLEAETFNDVFMGNPWYPTYVNQPIMANDDMFQF